MRRQSVSTVSASASGHVQEIFVWYPVEADKHYPEDVGQYRASGTGTDTREAAEKKVMLLFVVK